MVANLEASEELTAPNEPLMFVAICTELLTIPVGNCAELLIVPVGSKPFTCAEPLNNVNDSSVSAEVNRVLKEALGAEKAPLIFVAICAEPLRVPETPLTCAELLTVPAGNKLLICAEPLNRVSDNSVFSCFLIFLIKMNSKQ